VFIIVNALAQIIGSPIWGRFADRSARKVMIAAGVLAAAAGAAAVGLTLAPDAWRTAWTFAPVLLLLGVAYAGARLGRKTWLVDAAPKDQRPLYVAVSNTAIGVVVLAAGLMGVVAQFIGAAATVGVLAAVCLAGAAAAATMPEADTFSPQTEP
jgi:MFS family permease